MILFKATNKVKSKLNSLWNTSLNQIITDLHVEQAISGRGVDSFFGLGGQDYQTTIVYV